MRKGLLAMLVMALMLALGLACSGTGGSDEATTDDAEGDDEGTDGDDDGTDAEDADVALTSPWNGYNLPVGDGVVLTSNSTQLLIGYETADMNTLATNYTNSMTGVGFQQTDTYADSEVVIRIFKKDANVVGFASGTESGVFYTYMEVLQDEKAFTKDRVYSHRSYVKSEHSHHGSYSKSTNTSKKKSSHHGKKSKKSKKNKKNKKNK